MVLKADHPKLTTLFIVIHGNKLFHNNPEIQMFEIPSYSVWFSLTFNKFKYLF